MDEILLKRLEKERDKYLKEHPELQDIQNILDMTLENIADPQSRMNVMKQLLFEKRDELLNKLCELQSELSKLKKIVEQAKTLEDDND